MTHKFVKIHPRENGTIKQVKLDILDADGYKQQEVTLKADQFSSLAASLIFLEKNDLTESAFYLAHEFDEKNPDNSSKWNNIEFRKVHP